MKEPFVWFDDQHEDKGWVLRYSYSDEIGQRHLDEPLDISDPRAHRQAIRAAADYLGIPMTRIGVAK